MSQSEFQQTANVLWTAVLVVWLLAALRSKRTVKTQSMGSRIVHIVLLVTSVYLLFRDWPYLGVLDTRLLPRSMALGIAGLFLTAFGIGFALWARFFLGTNWSASVTMKRDHQLISRGPYAIVRHPIYSGFLLGMLGTAILHGRTRDLIGLFVAFIAWWQKSRIEEDFLLQLFDGEYVQYKGRVKALIPFLI
jgi:protein-S-isoprenylcysteine O-methyltransferase Ste14